MSALIDRVNAAVTLARRRPTLEPTPEPEPEPESTPRPVKQPAVAIPKPTPAACRLAAVIADNARHGVRVSFDRRVAQLSEDTQTVELRVDAEARDDGRLLGCYSVGVDMAVFDASDDPAAVFADAVEAVCGPVARAAERRRAATA